LTMWVIDTNVLCVAERLASHADDNCVDACTDFLESARAGLVFVDDDQHILGEYQGQLRAVRQPGPGTAFLRWLWQNIANESVCRQVPIVSVSVDPENYSQMPADPALAAFDPSDRKFVAVAVVAGRGCVIVNAVDSDWRRAEAGLLRSGLCLRFLCPQHV
jgi:hypothetical protein